MPGYFDAKFDGGSVPADPYDRDHVTPDRYPADPSPQEEGARLLYRGRWMTWDQYFWARDCNGPGDLPIPAEPAAGKRKKSTHNPDQEKLF